MLSAIELTKEARQIIDRYRIKLNEPLLIPGLQINSRLTRTAGYAAWNYESKTGLIKLSLILLNRINQKEREEIIVHEFCHLIQRKRYGRAVTPHGSHWKSLMIQAGFEPKRCHNIERSDLIRKNSRIRVNCGCLDGTTISTNRLTRMRNGSVYWCTKCAQKITY